MSDADAAELREEFEQSGVDTGVRVGPHLGFRIDTRPPQIRDPTATEREATVFGALAVDHHVPVVGEGRAVVETDLGPLLGGERLGRDHA